MPIAAPSEISREVDRAFLMIGGVSLLLLIGITLTMLLFVFRFRRGRASTTSQIEGHFWLEITWIVIPCIIVTWMFFVGYRGFGMMRAIPEDAMVVQVLGKQWSWSFAYPEEGITSIEMVVPVNRPVRVELTAPPDDVLHSFFIPDFRVKEDVIPGRNTSLWFKSERTGNYNIFCAEFCGKDHSQMISMLRVVTEEEYQDWVRQTVLKRYKPLEYAAFTNPDHPAFGPADLNIDAHRLYATYCASCHGAQGDGTGLPGLARDFRSSDGWKKGTSVAGIYRSLEQGIEGTQMRAFPNFTPWEKVALAHLVRGYLDTPPATDSEVEYDGLVAEYELDKIQAPKESILIDRAMDLLLEEAAP